MKKPRSPAQSAHQTSDLFAIFKEGVLVYASDSFKTLYSSVQAADREKISRTLCDLGVALQQPGEILDFKQVAIATDHGKIYFSVYLLDKSGPRNNHLLVWADVGSLRQVMPFSIPDPSLDDDQIPSSPDEKNLLPALSGLIGEDPHFKAVLFKAQRAAQSDYPVLIRGESGTGKEMLARRIHETSRRSRNKFVDINCAAIPDQLIDSELFGYEKGSFTGASPGGRHGLFVEAHQGTLFFDEIADASLQTQAKLLRVLTEGHFKRIGSTKNVNVDVRIISATNKDLSQSIAEKLFRQDLIYRLNTITIHIPALRERSRDIPLLANFFLLEHSKSRHSALQFTSNCLEIMKLYPWPGNVRELKGVVDYMVTMAPGSLISEKYFPDFLLCAEEEPSPTNEGQQKQIESEPNVGLLLQAVQNTEKEVIRNVLQQVKNKSEAIVTLGISRRTFYAKLKLYNLK